MSTEPQQEPRAMVPVYVAQGDVHADEISLIDLLITLLRSWRFIALGTISVTVLTVALVFLLPETYRSRSRLTLAVSDNQTLAFFGMNTEGRDYEPDAIARHFASFFSARQAIGEAFADVGVEALDGSPLTIEGKEGAVEVSVPDGLAQIEVAVELPDPELARDVANAIVTVGLGKVDAILRARLQAQKAQADRRRADAEAEWKEALDVYLDIQAKIQPERKARELATLREQRAKAQQELLLHKDEIVELEASIAAMKEAMVKIPEMFTLKRSLADNPQMAAAVATAAGEEVKFENLTKMVVLVDEANPLHRSISSRLAENEITYQERKALFNSFEKKMQDLGARIDTLLPDVERGQADLAKVVSRRDLAEADYTKANAVVWDMRGRLYDFQSPLAVLEPAVAPQGSISPKRGAWVMIGFVIGLFGFMIIAIARVGVRQRLAK